MGKSRILLGGMTALGLLSVIAASTGQAADNKNNVPHSTNGDQTLSAWQADVAWRDASMDNDADFEPVSSLSAASTEEMAARLAAIAPAAGPEIVDPDQAALALKKLGGDAVGILNNGQLDQADKVAEFHGLIARDFDIPLMARFALGRHWKRANKEQRSAYVAAFTKFILNQYAAKITGAKVASFDVMSAQRAGKRDVMVQSRIVQNNGQVLKLVWRMRQRDGQFRVIDVVAEGISLALTKRQEFAAIIKANGGDVAQLIDRLRQITA